jgi:hypothetical protein
LRSASEQSSHVVAIARAWCGVRTASRYLRFSTPNHGPRQILEAVGSREAASASSGPIFSAVNLAASALGGVLQPGGALNWVTGGSTGPFVRRQRIE